MKCFYVVMSVQILERIAFTVLHKSVDSVYKYVFFLVVFLIHYTESKKNILSSQNTL